MKNTATIGPRAPESTTQVSSLSALWSPTSWVRQVEFLQSIIEYSAAFSHYCLRRQSPQTFVVRGVNDPQDWQTRESTCSTSIPHHYLFDLFGCFLLLGTHKLWDKKSLKFRLSQHAARKFNSSCYESLFLISVEDVPDLKSRSWRKYALNSRSTWHSMALASLHSSDLDWRRYKYCQVFDIFMVLSVPATAFSSRLRSFSYFRYTKLGCLNSHKSRLSCNSMNTVPSII